MYLFAAQNGGMCRTHYLEAMAGADLEFYRPRVAAKEMPDSKDEDSEEDEFVKESAEESLEEEEEDAGSTWTCHLCGEEQSIEKKRCGHCRAWKGGTRDLQKSPEKKEKSKGSTPVRRPNAEDESVRESEEESEDESSEEEESEEEESEEEESEVESSEEEEDAASTWTCHLCGEEQSTEKKRCGHCRAWKGGTRDLEKSPEKKEKSKGSTPERRLNEKCIVTGCEKWGQGVREGHMCRRHFRENHSKESKPKKKKKKKAAVKSKVKTKPKASGTGVRLCSVSGCPKFRQSGHNGMCRAHYLASIGQKPRAYGAKESTCTSLPTNDQPPAQILVTAAGETVTTMKVASSSSPPAAMKSLDAKMVAAVDSDWKRSRTHSNDAKMVAAVDSDWKRSLQQLVSYQRKHGCDPAEGSKGHKWLAKQALEYARRQKKAPSELTKGHIILLEQKAGFVYGGKMDKRKLDEMRAGGSGAPVGSSSSSASNSSTGSNNDRPKKKARS